MSLLFPNIYADSNSNVHASLLQTARDISNGRDDLVAPFDHVPDGVVAVHCLAEVVIQYFRVALMIEYWLRHGWTASVVHGGVRRSQVVRGVFGSKHVVCIQRSQILQQRSDDGGDDAAHSINCLANIIQSLQRGGDIQTLLKLVMYVSHEMSESH